MVQLNLTTDYAIRLLIYLASVDRMAPSLEIAKEMNIPPKYITTVVAKLKEKAFIRTFQGSGGGYCLACSPGDITMEDIVETMQGKIKIKRCETCNPNCLLYVDNACPLCDAYDGIQLSIQNVLRQVTIQDLMKKNSRTSLAIE